MLVILQPALLPIIALLIFAAMTPLAALVALLVLAPMRTLIETEAPFRLPLDIGQILVIALVFFWFITRVPRQQRIIQIVHSPLFLPIGVFFTVVSLTAFSAFSMGAWLNEWLKWGIMLFLVVLILNTSQHWKWIVFGVVLAGLANALVGIYIFSGGSGADHLIVNERFFRAFGTFGQPNPFGGFMGLISPLAVATAMGYGWNLWQEWRDGKVLPETLFATLFYTLAAVFISIGVILSWSRGAWLGWIVAMGVVVIALPRRTWQSLAMIVLVIFLGATLWTSGRLPNAIVERIQSATAEIFAFDDVRGVDITPANYAVVERLAHWQAALNMARAYPFLGVGMGNYEIAYEQFRLINWDEPLGHAHNFYLNVLAEAGIIGLTGYVTLWIGIIWFTWRVRNHPDTVARLVAIGLLGTWTYLSIHSLTDNLYVNNMFLHIGVMIGLVAVLYRQTFSYEGQ